MVRIMRWFMIGLMEGFEWFKVRLWGMRWFKVGLMVGFWRWWCKFMVH